MSDMREAAIQHAYDFLCLSFDHESRKFVNLHDLAVRLAADHLERGEMPPNWTVKYAVTQLRAPTISDRQGKPGRDTTDNVARNIAIMLAVEELASKFNLKPTRNRATFDLDSAASLVHDALKQMEVDLAETSIEDIWADQGPEGWSPEAKHAVRAVFEAVRKK